MAGRLFQLAEGTFRAAGRAHAATGKTAQQLLGGPGRGIGIGFRRRRGRGGATLTLETAHPVAVHRRQRYEQATNAAILLAGQQVQSAAVMAKFVAAALETPLVLVLDVEQFPLSVAGAK